MTSSEVAAWVSAIGGLLAVCVSVYLHALTIAERRRSDRLQSRSAALHVLGDFRAFRDDIAYIVAKLDRGCPPDEIPSSEGPHNIRVGSLRHKAGDLLSHAGVLPTLGAAAESAQRAYSDVIELLRMFDGFMDPDDPDDWKYVGSRWPPTEQHLRVTAKRVEMVVQALEAEVR